jgi:Tfp pilus assembly protein PilN
LTITMDDQLADAVKATAGGNVSAWLTQLARSELLRRAVAAEIAADTQNSDYLAWRAERATEIEQAHA